MSKLRELLAELTAERQAIEDRTAPLRAERDRLLAEMAPALQRERELGRQIKALELPRKAEIDIEISAITGALRAVEPGKHQRLSDND